MWCRRWREWGLDIGCGSSSGSYSDEDYCGGGRAEGYHGCGKGEYQGMRIEYGWW